MRAFYLSLFNMLRCTTQHNIQIVFGGFDFIYIGINNSLTIWGGIRLAGLQVISDFFLIQNLEISPLIQICLIILRDKNWS